MKDQLPDKNDHLEIQIPAGLSTQLEEFKKRLWKIKIAEAMLAGFFGLLFSFLLVFAFDRLFETSGAIRLIILLCGISLFVIFAPYWIHRWVYGHRRENQLARLISRRFPRLGDRLLGAVELQSQNESVETLSPELRAAAMQSVTAEAAGRNLSMALPAARHRKWTLAVMILFILSVTGLVCMPEAGINSLKRWLMPLAQTERFTFTQLDISGIGSPQHIPYGESFSIVVPLSEDTNRQPATARARYGKGEWIEAPLKNNAYTFTFPGQRAKDIVRLEADDANYDLVFEPTIRPALKSIRASLKLPDYLKREVIDVDLRSGFTTALEGSEVIIRATADRSLSEAYAEIQTLPKDEDQRDTTKIDGVNPPKETIETRRPAKIDVKIDGRNISTPPINIASHSVVIPLNWKDTYGLTAEKPINIRIEATKDQAPSTYIQGIDKQHIMLAEETLSFEILAEDDFGLKACGISWQGELTNPTSGEPAKGEATIEQGNPNQATFNLPWKFCPDNHNITPQRVLLTSWTEDYYPGRGRVYSEPITLYILTRDEHAQVLKNEFDRVIGELEDTARKEQNLNDENQRLEMKDAKDLQKDENRKKLQDQQDRERENKENMENLTKKMEKLFKDSVRNGEIDKDILKKMSEALDSMKELSEQDLPKVEKKLQDAQSQRNTPEKSKNDLKEAIEEQKKAIEKMKQALKKANEANQSFEAGTFVNRLKRAASEEDGIASSILGIINQVIGCQLQDLDPVEKRAIKEAQNQQQKTAADVRWIQEDLFHYHARAGKEVHKKLVDSMRSSRIDEAMELLSANVSRNISYTSIYQSKMWAKQLRTWAKLLKGDKNQGGGGGGGGGGNQEDQDFEFMLKVMRMIQAEQGIRSRTRALEDFKRTITPRAATTSP